MTGCGKEQNNQCRLYDRDECPPLDGILHQTLDQRVCSEVKMRRTSTCVRRSTYRSIPVLDAERYTHKATVAMISVIAANPFWRPKIIWMTRVRRVRKMVREESTVKWGSLAPSMDRLQTIIDVPQAIGMLSK
jgi:hypothetical protein